MKRKGFFGACAALVVVPFVRVVEAATAEPAKYVVKPLHNADNKCFEITPEDLRKQVEDALNEALAKEREQLYHTFADHRGNYSSTKYLLP